uniref:Uncharacterized protein n=1 Tax=Cacopsylla melanoneura TaxID=428564 RepID=A0A8D8S0J4_9HEMI
MFNCILVYCKAKPKSTGRPPALTSLTHCHSLPPTQSSSYFFVCFSLFPSPITYLLPLGRYLFLLGICICSKFSLRLVKISISRGLVNCSLIPRRGLVYNLLECRVNTDLGFTRQKTPN